MSAIAGTAPLHSADPNLHTHSRVLRSPTTPRMAQTRASVPDDMPTSTAGAGPSRSPLRSKRSQPSSPVTPLSAARRSSSRHHDVPFTPGGVTEEIVAARPSSAMSVRNDSSQSVPKTELEEPMVLPEKVEYLQPAEFYPLNNGAGGRYVPPWDTSPDDLLSPEDDKDAKRGIPIFRPSLEEFKDFEGYVTKTVPWGQYSGIVKIIPPADWIGALPPISKQVLSDVKIKSPIQQTMLGRSGLFRVTNVEKRRAHPFDVQEWFIKSQSKQFVGPGPKDGDKAVDRDSKEAKERRAKMMADAEQERRGRREAREAALRRKEERAKQDISMVKEEPTHAQEEEAMNGDIKMEQENGDVPALSHSPHSSSTSDPMATTPGSDAIDPFYDTFDPKSAWLPQGTTEADYTAEACSLMEKKFWKSLLTREPSWYGADLQGSLFADKETPWNVSCLPNLLNRCSLTKKLPGVNSPYLYFGMYGATFAWHVEDMDLFSINYIHFGAPKFWYAVPQRHADRFEHTLAGYFPQDAQRCDQFLRHKSFTMSPTQLANDKIPVNMLVHNQGEYVITYPRGYHAGFNMGFNCAESINFALESWLELGRRAKVCECVEHSVRINVDEMLAERELIEAIEEERKVGKSRKRRRPDLEGEDPSSPLPLVEEVTPPKPRKIRIVHHDDADGMPVETAIEETKLPINGSDTKKRRIVIKKDKAPKPHIIKVPTSYPCLFCPSLATDDLKPVHEPTEAVRAQSQSTDGRIMAHHACALGIPEVSVEDVLVDGQAVSTIVGAEYIEAARWKLKCVACQDKKLKASGAKVQCIKAKCVKAFHVSCAQADPRIKYELHDVLEWPAPIPGYEVDPATMTPIKVTKVELLCDAHNPDQIAIRKLQAIEDLRRKILALEIGSSIKVKSKGGGIMHGTLIKVLAETGQVEVQLEIGQKYWVPYDRVEFKEIKPQMQENEYARTYNTKAKEPIPSRAIPVPPTPTRLPATTQPASRPSHIQQASQRTTNTEMRNTPHYPHPQAFAYPPPPMPHAHQHEQRPPHPSQYMQDPRIPTRVVPGYYPLPPPPHERTGTWPPTQRSLPYPPPQGHQATYIPPPLHFYGPPPPANGQFHGPPSHATQGASNAPTPMSMGPPPFVPPGGRSDKIDLTMAHMRRLMKHLPPLRIPAIHLAGTNGKGSVSAILESILKVAGLRTARYNSPHLIEARDAIRVDGVPPSKAVYDAAVLSVQRTAKEMNIEVSPFELATATAYYIFATSAPAIDVMVIECGMGGVNDATNVIPPQFNLASALTSVGLDHTNFLGGTISAIADQKARITVPGGLLFIAPHLHRDALRTAQTIGRSVGAGVIESFDSTILSRGAHVFQLSPFLPPAPSHVRTRLPVIMDGRLVPGEDCIGTRLSLGGKHQLDNLSLALTILHVISKDKRALSIQPALGKISPSVMQRGVELTKWEGRCSWVQYQVEGRAIPILVDGAHNADSAKTLRSYIDDLGPGSSGQTLKKHYIISLSSSPGKSPESVLGPLLRKGDKVTLMDFTTPVEGMPWVKPADKGEVQNAAEGLVGRGQVAVVNEKGVEGLKVALGKVEVDELAVVCGSLYLVADVYRLVQ